MHPRRVIAILVAVLASLAVVACGGSSSGGSQSTSTNATAKATPNRVLGQTRGPSGEAPTSISRLQLSDQQIAKIRQGNHTAALVWHTSSDFVNAVTAGAKDEFQRMGVKVVATTDANYEADQQKSQIETVLAKKPDVMLSLPVDPIATASAYRDAARAGTKIVLLSNVPKGFKYGRDYVALVTDDLFQMGKHAADALAKAMNDQGKVGYFFHDADYYVTNQRDQAFKKTIEGNYPGIDIVAQQGIADPNRAEDQANAMLTKNPNLDGIYVTFSEPAEGVLSALRNAGDQDTKMVTLDLSEPVALDMARGGNTVAVVADKAYALGQAMAKAAGLGLLGKPAPEFLVAPAITVTKDNLVQGYHESLHRAPPQDVLNALGQ